MMDLGKMLAEALAIDYPDGFHPRENGEYVIDAWIDLNAAAEAFLAKVREAESINQPKDHELASLMLEALRHARPDALFLGGYEEAFDEMLVLIDGDFEMVKAARFFRDALTSRPWRNDHTGPVPYRGEVE